MIQIITGPMFANKSTGLLNHIEYFKHIGKKRIYYISTSESISARNREPIFANAFPINLNINEYTEYIDAFKLYNMEVVIIDEAQFFGSWIIDFCFKLRLNNIEVVVAGLDMDAHGNPFGYMGQLMCIADKVEKKKAVCEICKEEAAFTIKKNDSPEIISIGKGDKYSPRCTEHLNTSGGMN